MPQYDTFRWHCRYEAWVLEAGGSIRGVKLEVREAMQVLIQEEPETVWILLCSGC